jgi:hypothetical protein
VAVTLAGALVWTLASGARAERIHFADPTREPLDGEIVSYQDAGIEVRVTRIIAGQRAGTVERIPWSAVDHLEYPPLPGETEVLADPASASPDRIKELWLAKLPHLKRPRSNAGDIGLLFAERLLDIPSEHPWQRSLEIFARIEQDDWNPANHARARQGRLRAMIALGRIDEATREAREMAEQTENPVILLEAEYVLGTVAFNRLLALEKEHPRWMDDDEVRPVRESHFHEALDHFLRPFLFYGSEEAASARGLVAAARVHLHAGDLVQARHCAGDVVRLYPDTSFRAEAERLLRELEAPPPASPGSVPVPSSTP